MSWIVWALLSAVFAAATALLAKIGVENVEPNLATAVRTTVVVVLAWAVAVGFDAHHGFGAITRRSWLFLVFSGLATGASWLCYFRALKLGPVSGVAPLDKLSVVLVAIAGWTVLGERMTTTRVSGVLLMAAGALVLALAK